MKKKFLVIFFIVIIVISYLYYSNNDKNSIDVIEIDENNISNDISKWLEKSKELKGANIYVEDENEKKLYYIYYESGKISYCKYIVSASYIKKELTIEIYKKPPYNDSDIKLNAFYCIEMSEKAEKINVKLDGEIIDWR